MNERNEPDSQETWECLLNHVILPRVLPQTKPRSFQETQLMVQMVKNVENLAKCPFMPPKTVELFKRLRRIHFECTPAAISEEINKLCPGDTFAMFVRRQNNAFIIYAPPTEGRNATTPQNVIVATFLGSLHPCEIYKHESDVQCIYPAQAIKVKFSNILRSEDFANQLRCLHEELPIETENRNFVSKWLVTLLADETSRPATVEEFPIIRKKIRDEVLGDSKKNYFRRSSYYMCLKVLLEHSLTIQYGNTERGRFIYKIVMLKFLTQMCAIYIHPDCITFNTHLLTQMMAKIARRIEKLSSDPILVSDKYTKPIYDTFVVEAQNTIKNIRHKIDEQIQRIQQKNLNKGLLPSLNGLNLESDISYQIPKLQEYLRKRQTDNNHVKFNDTKFKVKSFHRRFNQTQANSDEIMLPRKNDVECRIFWIDFENFILYQMKIQDNRWTASALRTLLFEYTKYAKKKYTKNRLFISRMILVCLKIIAMLDRMAIKEHPLLKEHRSGINPKIIESLLLAQRNDMQIAHQLEDYFYKRNEKANDPSLIEEKLITEQSFSVKFARQNSDMIKIRGKILEFDEKNVQQKRLQWSNGRDHVKSLRERASALNCDTNIKNNHQKICERCVLKMDAQKVRFEHYERLLPKEELDQFAVIFELQLPTVIACLRDALFSLNEFCRGSSEELKICSEWIKSPLLLPYIKSSSVDVGSTNTENNDDSEDESESEGSESTDQYTVTLGSTTQCKLVDSHVDEPFETFIIENGSNCVFHANHKSIPTSLSDDAIKSFCTFETHDEYSCLEWTLKSTLHTQNEVLSRQSECSPNLSLAEYKNFGSLRADGHRLQLRKLYALIETEALSFEKESVQSLVMQTLWECGVCGDGKMIRESHTDFMDPTFSVAMIELLNKFVEQQQSNWMHPFKLIMATLIAVRIFEINDIDSVADEAAKLFNGIRKTALDWIDKIEQVISCNMQNDAGKREMRLKIIFAAIAGCLTFFIHPKHKHYGKALTNSTDTEMTAFRTWLQLIITLKNNTHLYENNEDKLAPTLRMYLRLTETIGVFLEPKMKTLMKHEEVWELVRNFWLRAEQATPDSIHFHPNFAHILVAESSIDSQSYTTTIDIITGTFLLNGMPICRLPQEITQHELYQWCFGKMSFEVRSESKNIFITAQKYNNCFYEFQHQNNNVVITERTMDDTEKELIHYEQFIDSFPHLLVTNYTHWWDRQDVIEFRPKTSKQKHHSNDPEIDYELNLKTNRLVNVKTKQPMLNIMSDSFKKIVHQLSRLEHSKYIHVLMDPHNAQMASVELCRINLRFKIDCSKATANQILLQSHEWNGMHVSCKQTIGTLYGLNHGLLLENASDGGKLLLMPHGHIRTERNDDHVDVFIETENELRNPPFYEYQVDELFLQLKSSNSSHAAWFYLAYLHALTSHGEVEPFTGMSGTERALQILQSAFAWSSSPYEPEAIEMLTAIGKLSPIRRLKENKQVVTWPENALPHAAQDSFIFIVNKLLEDSQRLHGLYPDDKKYHYSTTANLRLNERDYHRCLQLNPNLRVSNAFIKHKVLATSVPDMIPNAFSSNTQIVSILYHKGEFTVPNPLNLHEFLTTEQDTLKRFPSEETVPDILYHNVYKNFPDLWIGLYDAARKQEYSREKFALILSLLAHQNEYIKPILALQAVVMNPNAFLNINPPPSDTFYVSHGICNETNVSNLLKQLTRNFPQSANFIDKLTAQIMRKWPCNSINLDGKNAGSIALNDSINDKLVIWYNNKKLNDFISDVENCLQRLPVSEFVPKIPSLCPFTVTGHLSETWKKFGINIEAKIRESLNPYEDLIGWAQNVWHKKTRLKDPANHIWDGIKTVLNAEKITHLIQSGLFPRIVPSFALPKLIAADTDVGLKALIGAWALTVAHEQRQKRIWIFSQRPELKHEMDREIENEPQKEWEPCDRPEWLIFEIEQNLTIRLIQVEIAKRMIQPPETSAKHSVMQLNMGEGKTAVIVPILAAVLANGNQACQITVLKPLFARNLKFLRKYLGALLNKKIYILPCRRDLPIHHYIQHVLDIYKECKTEKGVILTLPEYCLSLQLKIYESIHKDRIEAANRFLNVHKWINENVRNILDESDAILQANYQLIYTMGNRNPPDGDEQRWQVTQALLKRVPHHMRELCRKFGKEKVEFDDKYVENGHVFGGRYVSYRSDVFTPCRILEENIFDHLKTALVNDFLNGNLDIAFQETVGSTKEKLMDVLSQKLLIKSSFNIIEQFSLSERNTIMILSGLLRFEVLKLVLTKRWRVNYGVDPKNSRKMAIPFKAKDIAAEMTEFGHPDVAICFTQLSYYYSGLTDEQLRQTFGILESTQNSSMIYENWIQSISPELIDSSIKSYSGVNLDDAYQRDNLLFPLLRFNMHVIDFWLSKVVFPHEAKSFEKKLMCTAWDLCSDQYIHRVTGFSGTNDTKNVLPMTVAQNDLDKLKNTNDEMEKILLREENQSYESLPANVSGKEILTRLTKSGIRVLLDSGALMLELTNEEVAKCWLQETENEIQAAVYFDSHDMLQTIDRNSIITEFDCSVYRENLSNCVVYLDDVHTRGTDLKFPLNWKACVTLSGDITHDKTVQSCMRMRQLGKGHMISFWASYEADIRIRKISKLSMNDQVTNDDVFEFINTNSSQFETANMVHWTSAALNYTKKLIGHKLFENDIGNAESMKKLYDICVDDEFIKLDEMYGEKDEALLTKVAWSRFSKLGRNNIFDDDDDHDDIIDLVQSMQRKVSKKLKEFAPHVKQFSHDLEEEQERELEQEDEEERHIEPVPAVKPATPNFDEKLIEIVLNGVNDEILNDVKSRGLLLSVAVSLAHTRLYQICKHIDDAWANHLFVTKDFQTVVDLQLTDTESSQAYDRFLRPVWWIVRIEYMKKNGKHILVLLSSYECDRLLPALRESIKSTLYMYRPRLSKFHSNLLHDTKLHVSGMQKSTDIDVTDEVQIAMYSGSMNFTNEIEQNAYCGFLGVIPRPRTTQLETAFENGIIRPNGFVHPENRRYSEEIYNCVGQCKFKENPVDLAIKLIEAYHQALLKDSHVASILERCTKRSI